VGEKQTPAERGEEPKITAGRRKGENEEKPRERKRKRTTVCKRTVKKKGEVHSNRGRGEEGERSPRRGTSVESL